MEQEHISFGCSIVSSVTVKFAIVLLCACFIFLNNVHILYGNCMFLFYYTLFTQFARGNISFLYCMRRCWKR